MHLEHRARWISRERAATLRKAGALQQALLLDTFNGLIVVEPLDSDLGDGAILAAEQADYELQPIWFTGPKTLLREARRRLGLEVESAVLAN